jgi:hypothetical protein
VQVVNVVGGAAYNISYYIFLSRGASNNWTDTNSFSLAVAGQVLDVYQGSPAFGETFKSFIVNIPRGQATAPVNITFREVRHTLKILLECEPGLFGTEHLT